MPNTCGKCGEVGHNARKCKLKGFPLHQLIESKGHTLATAADGINYNRAAFTQVAAGRTPMSDDALHRLAALIRVPQWRIHEAYEGGRKLALQRRLEAIESTGRDEKPKRR